jgi:hypothetical protein
LPQYSWGAPPSSQTPSRTLLVDTIQPLQIYSVLPGIGFPEESQEILRSVKQRKLWNPKTAPDDIICTRSINGAINTFTATKYEITH